MQRTGRAAETAPIERRHTSVVLRAIAAALLLAISVAPTAGAAPSQEGQEEAPVNAPAAPFAVQPSGPDGPGGRDYFVYTLEPGETFGDTVAVSNLGDRPINFVIYSADAFTVRDEGGFTAARDGEPSTDVGSWIDLGAETYTVEPGTRIDVPFSITVPEDAEPGDHAGAILATDSDLGSIDPESTDPNLTVRQRVGARVYVRVGGPVTPALRIDRLDVEHSTPSFAVPFFANDGDAIVRWEVSNTGNIRLTPSAVVEVKGLFGRTIKRLPAAELPELLPGSNYVGATTITGLPVLERITVELTITSTETEVVGTSSYWAVPWRFVLLVLVLVAGVVAWRMIRRRRQSPPAPPAETPRSREAVSV
ncbi:MAG: WxL protein peptidoglycan domain-containing protein [Acidimicrobiales bacterium]